MRVRFLCLLVTVSFLLFSIVGMAEASSNNLPPVADPNGPYTGTRLFGITFDGTGSSDPDGDPLTYSWDFGDGNTATGPTPSHFYSAIGVYTVALTVTDPSGASDTQTTSATVISWPPVADPNGPYTGTVGVPLTLDGQSSYDPDGGSIISWEWDLDNDGEYDDATGATVTTTFGSAGTHIVDLRVTDDDGDIDECATVVTITEAPAVPETSLALPMFTSLATALYLAIRKRIGKN